MLHVLPPDDGGRAAANAVGPAAHRRALFHLQALRTAVLEFEERASGAAQAWAEQG